MVWFGAEVLDGQRRMLGISTNYYDSIVDEEELPLKLAGLSHCFRTEAGSAGRESKGLYRVHQFTKVEMFVFCRPEDSEAMHQHLLEIEERIIGAMLYWR